jgi:hypothetical protein
MTPVTTRPILDRRAFWDPKNDNYPMRRLVPPTSEPRSYTWPVGTSLSHELFLDQGQEGECVGYTFAHELAARPQVVPGISARDAHAIYVWAQRNDQWPGEDYSGTSVLAGVKALVKAQYYKGFSWSRNAREVATIVSRKGPVALGVDWHEGMWDVDENGFIRPVGEIVGGHAILCKGYSVRRSAFILHNSWGRSWGKNGCALLKTEDLQYLLDNDGEACLPLREKFHELVVWE